jgi:hypothetical protein
MHQSGRHLPFRNTSTTTVSLISFDTPLTHRYTFHFPAHRDRMILLDSFHSFLPYCFPLALFPQRFPYSHYGIVLDWVQLRTNTLLYCTVPPNGGQQGINMF